MTSNEYVKAGGTKCPVCQSDSITGYGVEIDENGATQHVSCDDCGAEWTDVYKLIAYSDLIMGRLKMKRIAYPTTMQRSIRNYPQLSATKKRKIRMNGKQIKRRLKYLRKEIEAERISYEEIAELQSLAEHIDPSDVLLLQWAGVEEHV